MSTILAESFAAELEHNAFELSASLDLSIVFHCKESISPHPGSDATPIKHSSILIPIPPFPLSMNIGIIGLGIIGSRVAANLRTAGHQVYVWSPTPRAIPNFLSGPAEIAEHAKIIQLFVRDDDALLETVETLKDALTHEHTVINSATVSPGATAKAASIVQSAAATFLDCPFTGSKDASAAGQLVYYVGGNTDALEAIRPVLEPSSKEIQHVGEIGQATVLKLATNMIIATQTAILGEALQMVESQGIAPGKLLTAVTSNACNSGIAQMKLPTILKNDFEPHFSTKNMLKDVRYALAAASHEGTDLPLATQIAGMLQDAHNSGFAENDFSSIARRKK